MQRDYLLGQYRGGVGNTNIQGVITSKIAGRTNCNISVTQYQQWTETLAPASEIFKEIIDSARKQLLLDFAPSSTGLWRLKICSLCARRNPG